MRISTPCTLSAALAVVSLCYTQISAATLTIHTEALKINVPPPKVYVRPPSPNVASHSVRVGPRDLASGLATGKRQH